MNYTKKSTLENIEDVERFFKHLLFERKFKTFQPSDDFHDYEDEYGEPLEESEVENYHRLVDMAYDICDKQGIDIEQLALDISLQ